MLLSVENPNNLLTFREYGKALKDKKIGYLLVGRVTQRESQLTNSVKKVLQTIDRNKKLNTSQIKQKTKLWPNSVNRVLKLLNEKQVVKIHRRKDNLNNEKIYSLQRNKAIIYLNKLILHKSRGKKWIKEFKISNKKFKKFERLLSLTDFKDQTFTMGNRNITFNEDIPYLLAHNIIFKTLNGFYCETCLEKKIISELKNKSNNIMYCEICGSETYDIGPEKTPPKREELRLGTKNPFSYPHSENN